MSDDATTTGAVRNGLGSWYFLGFVFFLVALLLWLRGMGRIVLPALLLGLAGYGLYRFVKMVREPLDE